MSPIERLRRALPWNIDGGRLRIAQLTAALGLSERTLRRRCESAFGYGPKTLERILRFQQFLRLLRRSTAPRLAELAAEYLRAGVVEVDWPDSLSNATPGGSGIKRGHRGRR